MFNTGEVNFKETEEVVCFLVYLLHQHQMPFIWIILAEATSIDATAYAHHDMTEIGSAETTAALTTNLKYTKQKKSWANWAPVHLKPCSNETGFWRMELKLVLRLLANPNNRVPPIITNKF